jgi:hypothetical protein
MLEVLARALRAFMAWKESLPQQTPLGAGITQPHGWTTAEIYGYLPAMA